MSTDAKNTPAEKVQVGNVQIAIWRNTGSKGEFFTASAPIIRYKDDQGDFQDGTSYGALDLLALAEAAREAAAKIRELQRQTKTAA
jgi:hypothetical protein